MTASAVAAASAGLKPGFSDPVFDSQLAFRAVLDAMSYPGRAQAIGIDLDPPMPLAGASTATMLMLFDFGNEVWLDHAAASGPVPEFLRFHCGTRLVSNTNEARFAVVADPSRMPALESFAIGDDRYPDQSATLVIEVQSLTAGPPTIWTGPGIKMRTEVRVAGLPQDFWQQWALNHELYPLGVDIIFASGESVIGLPRSIKVEG